MYERYMICEDSLRNVGANGQPDGFEFDVRITYYRGIVVSMIDGFDVTVDGETFDREQISFTVRDRTYTLDELLEDEGTRWEFGERATLCVAKPGGLAPGEHTIEAVQHLRIPYMPQGLRGADTKTISLDGHGGGT